MGCISSSPSPCQVRVKSSSDSSLCNSRWYAKVFFSFRKYSSVGFSASSMMSSQGVGDLCGEEVWGGVPPAGGAPDGRLKVAPPPTMQCVRR